MSSLVFRGLRLCADGLKNNKDNNSSNNDDKNRPCPPQPNLAPNKFQERPSDGATRMQETLLAAAALLRTSLWELTALPTPVAGGKGTGCPLPRPYPRS